MIKFSQIAVSIGLCATLASTCFAKGNEGSGGGTVVSIPGYNKLGLLDLYLDDPKYYEQTIAQVTFQDSIEKSCTDINGSLQASIGFTIFSSRYAYVPFDDAVGALKKWEDNSPAMYHLILAALESDVLQQTYGEVPHFNGYWLPDGFEKKHEEIQFQTAAFYQADVGAVISADVYNKMDGLSQAGLLLHEAIRQVQNDYGDQMSEEILQKLVAKILLHPNRQDTLDDPSLYGPGIANAIKTFKTSEDDDDSAIQDGGKRLVLRGFVFDKLSTRPDLQALLQVFKTNNPCVRQ
jgi:hypothetical protein